MVSVHRQVRCESARLVMANFTVAWSHSWGLLIMVLNLEAIKARQEFAAHSAWTSTRLDAAGYNAVAECANDVPALVAEVERLRDEAARKHAAERGALIEALLDQSDAIPGLLLLGDYAHDIADALLAPGGPLVDVREVQAKALEALADTQSWMLSAVALHNIRARAAEIREAR